MKLPIIQAPDPILRTVCEPVFCFDDDLKHLAKDMIATIDATVEPKGIGLAANQVGFAIRLIVTHIRAPKAMCNPVIESRKGEIVSEELCLSEPGIRVKLKRAAEIKVRYQDLDGNHKSLVARDLLARCIQHEIDHLDGKLLSDSISEAKSNV